MRKFEGVSGGGQERPWQNHERNIQTWEREFRNTNLAMALKQNYESRPEDQRVPVLAFMPRRRDFRIDQRAERDGLGCVVAVYRMGLDEQAGGQGEIIGQSRARQILGQEDPVAARGGMANLGSHEARILGIKNPMETGEFKISLNDIDQTELANKPLICILPKALERGHFIMATGPMGYYSGQKGGTSHAVYIYGLKYEDNDQYKFLVKDPLGSITEWNYQDAIESFWKFNYIIAPGGDIVRNLPMKTDLMYSFETDLSQGGGQSGERPNNPPRKTFIAGETKKTFRAGEIQPQKVVFKRKKKFEVKKPDDIKD